MLTTACPSCASPLTFASGGALTAICPACGTVVAREGDVVRDYGKIARFQRDLSPIRVDAHGRVGERAFRVVGVLRKARDRVRWNEWYVVFDDGTDGWIGEGNGEWTVFAESVPVGAYRGERTGAGDVIRAGDAEWRVTEASDVAVVAAEGSLPHPFTPYRTARYFDLREENGVRVGTLDFADTPPTLWIGRGVTLVQLQMEGLRPFAGWSDPALVHFAGPEITETRALRCEACGASNAVRAPGATQRLACAYCGSVLAVEATGDGVAAELLEQRSKAAFEPRIPLGTRGRLEGVEWQVIGAMVRSTWGDGMEWSWTELALFNPYRGFAWLVQDTNFHWSFVEPVRGAIPTHNDRVCRWRGRSLRLFQRGDATVKHVLGEFTWEVAVGDTAFTADFIDPPAMVSLERTGDELNWSVGTWLARDVVERAFGVRLPPASGIAAHQPNPYDAPGARRSAVLRGGGLIVVSFALMVAAFLAPGGRVLTDERFVVATGENAWVTAPVALEEATIVGIDVDALRLPSRPDVVLSLLNPETGEVWDWTTYGDAFARARLSAGTWQGRLALPVAAAERDVGSSVHVRITTSPPWKAPAILLFLFSLGGPIAWLVGRGAFEATRWQNADTG